MSPQGLLKIRMFLMAAEAITQKNEKIFNEKS
jgi:hypothetical protein